MACGTGKTFTGLTIAEELAGAGGNSLAVDDASKIVGCYKALVKCGLKAKLGGDGQPTSLSARHAP